SGKLPQIGHLKPFGCQVTILNTSDHLDKFEEKADEGYLVGYTRFKTDTPAGAQATNIIVGNQDDDSDSKYNEQVIVVPLFPSNSFAGPSSSTGPSVTERNADYAEELARIQRQAYEAKDAAERHGYLFSQETADILSQT
nr:retrovirus-related Pol polyprotein from transposon TNT 1-94 [Tanacetum cinerariifolium]